MKLISHRVRPLLLESAVSNTVVQSELLKVYSAYKQCYSTEIDSFLDKYDNEMKSQGSLSNQSFSDIQTFIRKMRKSPHESPLEQGSVTFHITGVSRNFSHQFVRHRIASHGHQSQRYVLIDKDTKVVLPESIINNENWFKKCEEHINSSFDLYTEMVKDGIPKEDARYLIPSAISTALVSTMNFRELINFFKERLCNRAQKEIRDVAWEMYYYCRTFYPCIFENTGPKCILFGKCPEVAYCGKGTFRNFNEIFENYCSTRKNKKI